MFVLPLALPGIITGIALSAFFNFNNVEFSIWTIVVGHTTFCIVVVYNNVLARLRRTQGSLVEAAMDLGANGFQTFRTSRFRSSPHRWWPGRCSLLPSRLTRSSSPHSRRGLRTPCPSGSSPRSATGRLLPEVNVVVSFVILVTIIPVVVAARLTGGGAARVPAAR